MKRAFIEHSSSGVSDLNPIKTLVISGQLLQQTSHDSQRLYLDTSYADFLHGTWQVAVREIFYHSLRPLPVPQDQSNFFEISTNFVFGQYTETNERQPIPLARFHYMNGEEKLITLEPQWFEINTPSRCFQANLQTIDMYVDSRSSVGSDLCYKVVFFFRRIQ